MTRQRLIAIGQTVGVLMLMSLGTVYQKKALSDVKPFTFVAITLLIGMVAMSIYTFVIRGERIPRGLGREVWSYILAIGLGNFVISRIMQVFALQRLPATTNAYVGNFIGFLTMGMSIFILKESPTLFQILGAVIAITGLRIFFAEIPAPDQLIGLVMVLVGITAVAYTNNIARKLAIVTNNKLSNNIVSCVALLIGGSITVVVGLAADWPIQVNGWENWTILVYNGLISVAFGLTVWNAILRVLRSYEASILGASSVIWTSLLAIPVLGERLALNQMMGIGLMLAGLTLVQVRRGRLDRLWTKKTQTVSVEEDTDAIPTSGGNLAIGGEPDA
jgi:drug/metabolite transporter (DMT)-like permease